MKRFYVAILLLTTSLSSFSQFKNIMLAEPDDKSYPPVEPSIAINKKNPRNIVAGVVLNRVIVTNDGGQTWTTNELKSPFGVYGDPALISNSKGHLFYFHLADPSGKGRGDEARLDRIVCQ